MSVTFLGTTSGGGPTDTRNCSSLVVDATGRGASWSEHRFFLVNEFMSRTLFIVFDCAEGTVRQYALQPYHDARRVKINDLNKIFITHMHGKLAFAVGKFPALLTDFGVADHTMGIITILRNALGIFKGDPHTPPVTPRPVRQPKVQIYGPAGIRQLIRTAFHLTHTRSADQYCVHELLFPGEAASAPADAVECLHPNEEAGTDIRCDEDGFWRKITFQGINSGRCEVIVDAGPIVHRGDEHVLP